MKRHKETQGPLTRLPMPGSPAEVAITASKLDRSAPWASLVSDVGERLPVWEPHRKLAPSEK
jgi:hypothetical protein